MYMYLEGLGLRVQDRCPDYGDWVQYLLTATRFEFLMVLRGQ